MGGAAERPLVPVGRAAEFESPAHVLNWSRVAGRNRSIDLLRARGGRYVGLSEAMLATLAAEGEGDAMLELSASFRDGRAAGTRPSVSFMAQIFLFSGDPLGLPRAWPNNLGEALASGAAFVHTMGEAKPEWHRLGAKCLVPPGADFAVIQIAVRPNLRPAVLESLYADEIELTLTTRPDLPVRVVER